MPRFIEPLVVVALLFLIIFLLRSHSMNSEDTIATLVGALIGSFALILGNWLAKLNEQNRAHIELKKRVCKVKALVAAELVNVAVGLMGDKELMDAAVESLKASGSVPSQLDLTLNAPRPMPFTDSLGPELLTLQQREIDVLMTLRSNLSVTQGTMAEVTTGRRSFGLLMASQLGQGIRHDMAVLAEGFECFAPKRELSFKDKKPELATTILKRLANES
jgi:hypothetical protein